MYSQTTASGAVGATTGAATEGVTVGAAPVSTTLAIESGNQTTPEPAAPQSAPTLYRGTDEVIRMPAPQQPVQYFGDAVSLNF